jgi:hypothetical protein
MPRKKRPGWSAPLTRSLTLKDGTKLVTLADARAILIEHFASVSQSDSVARAIELTLKAADSGAFEDRKAATDQVAIVLRGRRLY